MNGLNWLNFEQRKLKFPIQLSLLRFFPFQIGLFKIETSLPRPLWAIR